MDPNCLLEITIISAQELPPVSKMLRTFAVAYLQPDHKLTTRIDHTGHTNPTWNYKLAFYVDHMATITFEIYNLAWLRDVPIGTARLFLSNLSPPLHTNPAYRHVSLQIYRPSGHLQGMLNIGIQLVDMAIPEGEPEKIASERSYQEGELWDAEVMEQENNPRSRIMSSLCPTPDSCRLTNTPESEPETRTTVVSSNIMRPLPTEVAEDLKMGYCSAGWNEYGTSIFDGWTEAGDDDMLMRSRSVKGPQWIQDDHNDIHLRLDEVEHGKLRQHKKKKKAGLLSCFAYGIQISIFCGSKAERKKKDKNKKNKKNKRDALKHNVHLMTIPDKNLRGFYV